MSAQEVWPEIGPHTTHLHLLGSLPEPHDNEAFLRDDQRAALEILSYEKANPRTPEIVSIMTDDGEEKFTIANMLMNAHTRWGKFEVAMAFFGRYKQENPDARGLYLAHTKGLIKDGREKFERRWGDTFSAGEFHGGKKEFDEFDMLFSTFQSIRGEVGSRFTRRHFGFKIVDESHHSEAPTYKEVIQYFVPDVRLGITATPNRLDQLDIRRTYGQEVVDAPLAEGIVRGNLRPMTYKVMLEDSVKSLVEDGAPSVSDLNKVTARIDPNLKEMIKRGQTEIRESGIKDPKVIHFAQSIQQAEDIACYLPNSSVIHSGQSDQENDEAIRRFREGEVDHVISINMLNEGIDLPSANVIAFYRSTESENIFIQQLGRGLEPAEDGSPLLVLDYVANAKRLEFIHNLMHGITTYALEADEYKQSPRREPNGKDYNEPDWINVPRSLGAKFELDEELLKVVEAINEQKDYMEKKKRFENLTEFEALAYVANIGRRNEAERGAAVNVPLGKAKIADAAKRGLGPTLGALEVATGLNRVEMMNSVKYGHARNLNLHNDINNAELLDAIVLMVQDIIQRHHDSENSINTDQINDDTAKRLYTDLNLLENYKIWLEMKQQDDTVKIELPGQAITIIPHQITIQREDASHVVHNGWSVDIGRVINPGEGMEFEEKMVLTKHSDTVGIRKSSQKSRYAGRIPNGYNLASSDEAMLKEVFIKLSKIRQELTAENLLTNDYPFYSYRSIKETGTFLNNFTGVDENEWDNYAYNRENIIKASPYVDKLRKVIKVGSQIGFDWLDQKNGNEFIPLDDQVVSYDPITDVMMVTSRTNPNVALQFSLDDNRMNKIGSDVRTLDMGIIFPRGKTSEHIDAFYGEVLKRKFAKQAPIFVDGTEIDSREEVLAYTHDWLEKFIVKVNAAQGYISSDQLNGFTDFGDEVIGKFFNWVDPNDDDKENWGIIKSVDYKNGTVEVFNDFLYKQRKSTKTFKIVKRSKTGLFELKPALQRNLYIESVDL